MGVDCEEKGEGMEDKIGACAQEQGSWSQSWDLALPTEVLEGLGVIHVVSAHSIVRLVPGLPLSHLPMGTPGGRTSLRQGPFSGQRGPPL